MEYVINCIIQKPAKRRAKWNVPVLRRAGFMQIRHLGTIFCAKKAKFALVILSAAKDPLHGVVVLLYAG